jgi:hypothetical protein
MNSKSFPAAGGNGWAGLDAPTGCAWTENASASWITLDPPLWGTGTGGATFSMTANTGAARTGKITLGGQVFTVKQAAAK